MSSLNITIIGLTITSSWGNGHATTFRALLRALASRGHTITFLECDKPWFRDNRDMPEPDFCRVVLYEDKEELLDQHRDLISDADVLMIGSYVPDGPEVIEMTLPLAGGVTAFYDIDTPITLAGLRENAAPEDRVEYLRPDQPGKFDLYFSFAGGDVLKTLENQFGAQKARPLYCSVDLDHYYPVDHVERTIDLGYLGTYSDDRQPTVDELLIKPARNLPECQFVVGGPQYPDSIDWPDNVEHRDHIPPAEHRDFYNAQRFTLNVTRREMRRLGWSPSVRLFEAAACGTPIISDYWQGLEEILKPGEEILIVEKHGEAEAILRDMSEDRRREIAGRALTRIKSTHSSLARAEYLEEELTRQLRLSGAAVK